MKKNTLIYTIILWLTLSLVATYLKLTHKLDEITQMLFLIVFLLSVYIVIFLFKKFNTD